MKAPLYNNGKRLCYEETFRSAFARPTNESAQGVLKSIREAHDSSNGWVEIESWIEETPQGFVAVRHHAKYE